MTPTRQMDNCMDFLILLDGDTCRKILLCLDDLADVLRASAVSRSWRNFVVENGICRQLCLRMFPPLSRLDRVIQVDVDNDVFNPEGAGPSRYMELALDRDHCAFAALAHACTSSALANCFSEAVSASSTDNYPVESVHNTLVPGIRSAGRASYWSSKGQSNPAVPETLIYKLCSKICMITQINIQPFQAYFQLGFPIYSAQSVRFRIGHPKNPTDNIDSALVRDQFPEPADDKFIWTYTSEAFPMAQIKGGMIAGGILSSSEKLVTRLGCNLENRLQKFKLPKPVLCIGGFLQMELIGRVQTQETDGLFYICVAHVQALGRSLSPAFDVDILEPSGKFLLKYFPHMEIDANGSDLPEDIAGGDSSSDQHVGGPVYLAHILNMFRGGNVEFEWEDDPEESDEEFVA